MNLFENLGLNGTICEALNNIQLETPTPIQQESIPEILAKKDVLMCSKYWNWQNTLLCFTTFAITRTSKRNYK